MFGVYVHWPFCLSKCPYCDFNSHVHASIDHESWTRSYLKEIGHYAALTPGRTVTSIFFGGGTPSLMQPETVAAVIEKIGQCWNVAPDCEITLEANPTSIEAGKFRGFADGGVNRVSIGVQALSDQALKKLGRTHSAAEALRAIAIARDHFKRYSFDLIYARPQQTPQQWRAELSGALAHAGDHVSLYQLTIEPGTAFHTLHARGELVIPDNDTAGEFYDVTQEIMESAGLPAYEISNHARPGAQSRHNLTYWHYGDYAGIGPGAHGRLTLAGVKKATRAHRAPESWQKLVDAAGHGAHPFEDIGPRQRVEEALMMGLRLREGINLDKLRQETGTPWQEWIDAKKLARLEDEGLATLRGDHLAPTLSGMIRLDSILRYIL